MKKNYTFKTISKGLAIVAIALSTTLTSAQVATDYFYNLRTLASTDYADGPVTIVSTEDIEVEGVKFKLQAIITPGGNATFVGSNGNRQWGVGTSGTPANVNTTTTFEGDEGDAATVHSIAIVDFDANGTGYTQAAISNLHFDAISVKAAHGGQDNPKITVDGANPGPFEIGQLTGANVTITFGVPFSNAAATSFTIGGTDDVTSITLANSTAHFQNAYQIVGTKVSYTFTTDPSLSVNSFKNETTFNIYPTITSSTFTINKEFKSLKIIDLTGKTVKSFASKDALNVSGLGSGVYLVKLKSKEGNLATSKLIVK